MRHKWPSSIPQWKLRKTTLMFPKRKEDIVFVIQILVLYGEILTQNSYLEEKNTGVGNNLPTNPHIYNHQYSPDINIAQSSGELLCSHVVTFIWTVTSIYQFVIRFIDNFEKLPAKPFWAV